MYIGRKRGSCSLRGGSGWTIQLKGKPEALAKRGVLELLSRSRAHVLWAQMSEYEAVE